MLLEEQLAVAEWLVDHDDIAVRQVRAAPMTNVGGTG
jgi:hypothetical protein